MKGYMYMRMYVCVNIVQGDLIATEFGTQIGLVILQVKLKGSYYERSKITRPNFQSVEFEWPRFQKEENSIEKK